ncbi:peptidoglycan-binding domain-containing protein [Allokutzneria albata]|uniref:Peptidoglycan-binding (PGRP) domain of peptidoglycan hydrolases-containing protein n=1 Tax=Allokutzneria albata TaxID=211114 RepID=A0A1G9ZC41_ALLAB|nr:peptidoglycan-binding protein [Allokutzneria albata]SDN18938.1 Peptidoglycan-binding (PGRP) domain of peptidoglycan hydrolases-containing protein [Allokutzneria albata]
MRKFGVRAIVVAVLAAGLSGVAAVTGAGTAMACEVAQGDSREFAATLSRVEPGQRGIEVLGLQRALRFQGYGLRGTGLYAENTLAAVKDFQRRNGIVDDGVVDQPTWQALVGPLPARQTSAVPLPERGIQPGAHDPEMMDRLHDALTRLEVALPGYHDGHYDEAWQAIVRAFQRNVGIRDSGIIGPLTWNALYRAISISGQWGC